jgi:protein required for attachment to host cells
MSGTWILVAESSRAKLYRADNRKSPISEVESLEHPEGRLHEGDLVSDRPGSDSGSIVGQGRHILDDKTTARRHEHITFAKQLAARLDAGRNQGDFSRLVLVAPPAFLGLLRDNLSKEVMDMVYAQVDKNLVQQPAETLRAYM